MTDASLRARRTFGMLVLLHFLHGIVAVAPVDCDLLMSRPPIVNLSF